ncbi:MAG: nucleotidyltransferase domain-containing protein [Peptococcaceae bacterium]|nr:nucleotidyltransferase domain-containing protein [Peptococcaceae bacterium]
MMKNLTRLKGPGFKAFCREHGITLAVLFGSQAGGRATRESDIDLAVWLEQTDLLRDVPDAVRAGKKLMRDVINYLETGNVDLVILNYASPLLKFQVARTGKPVYQKTPEIFAGFCSRALREHNDAGIFYRATEAYLQRVIERRNTGGRPAGRQSQVAEVDRISGGVGDDGRN